MQLSTDIFIYIRKLKNFLMVKRFDSSLCKHCTMHQKEVMYPTLINVKENFFNVN